MSFSNKRKLDDIDYHYPPSKYLKIDNTIDNIYHQLLLLQNHMDIIVHNMNEHFKNISLLHTLLNFKINYVYENYVPHTNIHQPSSHNYYS
jgi:hypothetical protein